MVVTNASHAYLNGGEFGHCKVKAQAYMTIDLGAKVEKISYWGISTRNLGNLTIKNGVTINELFVDPDGGNPRFSIEAGANISLLKFDIYKPDGTIRVKTNYFANVSIDANAKISKIIVGDKQEFTDLSVFLDYVKGTEW